MGDLTERLREDANWVTELPSPFWNAGIRVILDLKEAADRIEADAMYITELIGMVEALCARVEGLKNYTDVPL